MVVYLTAPIIGAVLVLLWAWRSGTPWKDIGYVRPKSWIGGLAVGVVLGVALKFLMKALVMPLLGADPQNQAYHYLAGNPSAIPAMLYAIFVGAGFGEETVFRGFFFGRGRKLIGWERPQKIAIVVVVAVLFGIGHYRGQGLAGAEQATIVGLLLGGIYTMTGELWMLMCAHVAFDLRHPDQVPLTGRSTKARRAGFASHVRRFLRARAEHRADLRAPTAQLGATPVVLVAVDTSHPTDLRQAAIRFAVSQILSLSQEFRLLCLTVIESSEASLEHLLKLQEWVAPFALPKQRLSLHAIASDTPADVIVELARYNNVDLVVLGAPARGGRAWSQSVASAVTPRVDCSVHVVRVPKR